MLIFLFAFAESPPLLYRIPFRHQTVGIDVKKRLAVAIQTRKCIDPVVNALLGRQREREKLGCCCNKERVPFDVEISCRRLYNETITPFRFSSSLCSSSICANRSLTLRVW